MNYNNEIYMYVPEIDIEINLTATIYKQNMVNVHSFSAANTARMFL